MILLASRASEDVPEERAVIISRLIVAKCFHMLAESGLN